MSKTIAIVLSGGKGKRMASDISKQYMLLDGKPILFYTLQSFDKSNIDEVLLVVGEGDEEYVRKEIVDKYNIKKVTSMVAGGKERYNSVYNALSFIEDNYKANEDTYVLVHDGARPFIQSEDINKMIEEVKLEECCIMGVKTKDTIKISTNDNYIESTPIRSNVWQIQTPQAFRFSILKKSYDEIIGYNDSTITDDSMVVERTTNRRIKLIEGKYTNIKITTPEDLKIGLSILNKNQ